MLAFERALAVGADALEFDVRLSCDGILMVIHDPTVDRTTNGAGRVSDLTARELASFDAGAGEGIPTADAVLEAFPNVPLIIEVKETTASVPLAKMLERHHATARVLAGSFIHAASLFRLPLGSRGYQAFTVPVRQHGLRVVDEAFVSAARRTGMPVHVWTVDDKIEADRLRAIGIAGIITNRPDRLRNLGGC
jgi:glycerophosphoryl diester phosphodiesterase